MQWLKRFWRHLFPRCVDFPPGDDRERAHRWDFLFSLPAPAYGRGAITSHYRCTWCSKLTARAE